MLGHSLINGNGERVLVERHINILHTLPVWSGCSSRESGHRGPGVRGGTQRMPQHALNQSLRVGLRSQESSWGMEGRTPKVEATAATGLCPGPLRERTPQDGIQGLPHGRVKRCSSPGDVGGKTGPEDVEKLWESKTRTEESSLQMRIVHVMQNTQALPNPLNSVPEHGRKGDQWDTKGGRTHPG